MQSSVSFFLGLMVAGTHGLALAGNSTLAACLEAAGSPYYLPDSDDWADFNSPFNERLKFKPVAIAVPETPEQAQAALICGKEQKVKVTPKAGGHSYASLGFGGEDGHLVIQLDHMSDVTLDKETNIATVAAGTRLGNLALELYNQGKRAISHGTCPGVGVSGHVLHGGYGMSSHTRGLALDWVVGISVLLASGEIVEASASENPDLFWGMLGAGSNFGIALSYRFKTFEAPEQATIFSASLPWKDADAAIAGLTALEAWTQDTMPAELNMRLAGGSGNPSVEGVFYGDIKGLNATLGPLLNQTGGRITLNKTTDWMGALEHYAYTSLNQTLPYEAHETFYAKSLTLSGLSGTSLENFAKYWYGPAKKVSRVWWFQLDLHGGKHSFAATAVADGDANATSYAHRDKLYIVQLYDRVFFGDYPADGFGFLDGWVANTTAGLADDQWGMYMNYADARLGRAEAQDLYWRRNVPELRRVKAKFDPDELFYYPISIEPAA